MEKATFGAGCFWGVEQVFAEVPGVSEAVSGYEAARSDNPTYRQVCTGRPTMPKWWRCTSIRRR